MGVPVVMGLKKRIHIRISIYICTTVKYKTPEYKAKIMFVCISIYVSVITVTHLATIDHLVTYVVCKCTIK